MIVASSSVDLRPKAVLSIGVAGISKTADGEILVVAEQTIAGLLRQLFDQFRQVVEQQPLLFAAAAPECRLLLLGCEGSWPREVDRLLYRQWETTCIVPSEAALKPTGQVESLPEQSDRIHRFLLPGSVSDGGRADERAYEVMLANADILIAIWDGRRGDHRGAIDELIQSAVARTTPVIVIAPANPTETFILTMDDPELDRPIALDLTWTAAPLDLTPLIRDILMPRQPWAAERALADLCAEPPAFHEVRKEYSILLALFGVTVGAAPHRGSHTRHTGEPIDRVFSEFLVTTVTTVEARNTRIDQLANHYANVSRGSFISEFLILILVASLTSAAALLFPSISAASLIIQVIVNGLILIDVTLRRRRRWVERWQDYRALAERLRLLRILHAIGQGDGDRADPSGFARPQSWVSWYVRRIQRGLPPPRGTIRSQDISVLAKDLVENELKSQLVYHRRAFFQLSRLDRRLFLTARAALVSTVLIGIALAATSRLGFVTSYSEARTIALIALGVLPALVVAFTGIRAEADLRQLVIRSTLTAAHLKRLRRALNRTPLNYDRLVSATRQVAHLTDDELFEWRLMLESRRLRRAR